MKLNEPEKLKLVANVEAALCVWESVLEHEDRELMITEGVVAARTRAIEVGIFCEDVYQMVREEQGEDFLDGEAFDWDIVPFLVDMLNGFEGGYMQCPLDEYKRIAANVLIAHVKDEDQRQLMKDVLECLNGCPRTVNETCGRFKDTYEAAAAITKYLLEK